MWIPEKYRIRGDKIIKDFIENVGLATLITVDNDFPIATHTPEIVGGFKMVLLTWKE